MCGLLLPITALVSIKRHYFTNESLVTNGISRLIRFFFCFFHTRKCCDDSNFYSITNRNNPISHLIKKYQFNYKFHSCNSPFDIFFSFSQQIFLKFIVYTFVSASERIVIINCILLHFDFDQIKRI